MIEWAKLKLVDSKVILDSDINFLQPEAQMRFRSREIGSRDRCPRGNFYQLGFVLNFQLQLTIIAGGLPKVRVHTDIGLAFGSYSTILQSGTVFSLDSRTLV